MTELRLRPVALKEALAFIRQHHRHHGPSRGWKFGAGVERSGKLVGVIVAGRPVARLLDDGLTLEVTRCCTDGTPNAPSMLYGAVRRAAKALGYRRLVTYTLHDEPGTSLRASGWRVTGQIEGRSWSVPSRPRQDKHPLCDKTRWEVEL